MAVAAVQHRSAFGTGVTSLALAFASNNGASNLLVYGTIGASGTSKAATDSNTNTIANAVALATGASNVRVDYVASSGSGANTVTGHSTSSADIHLHLWEVSGCTTSSPVRDSGTVANNATGSVSTSTTATQSGDAVLAFFDDEHNDDALTADASATALQLTQNTTGLDSGLSEFKAATSSGTQTMTCGGNGANGLGQAIVTFIAAAASSAFDIPQLGLLGIGF